MKTGSKQEILIFHTLLAVWPNTIKRGSPVASREFAPVKRTMKWNTSLRETLKGATQIITHFSARVICEFNQALRMEALVPLMDSWIFHNCMHMGSSHKGGFHKRGKLKQSNLSGAFLFRTVEKIYSRF